MERNNNNRAGAGAGGRGHGGGGGSRGGHGGRGTGNGRGGNYQQQGQQHQSGGDRGFRPVQGYDGIYRPPVTGQGGRGGHTQMANNPPPVQKGVNRPVQGQEGANRLPVAGPTSSGGSTGAWGRGGTWSGAVARNGAPPPQPQPQATAQIDLPDVQSLKISVRQPPSIQGNEKGRIVPMKRPDSGGKSGNRRVRLQANCFLIKYNPVQTMLRYDVQIELQKPPQSRFAKRPLKISDLRILWEKLFTDNPSRFRRGMAVFDGHSVFSSVELPTGVFKLELLDGEEVKAGSYMVTIKFVNEVNYSVLDDCMSGVLEYNPRDVLQGLDLVMKENPSRNGMNFGRSTFPFQFRREDDLHCGVAAFRGFQQSVKLSSQGLNLVLDTSVLPLRKSMPVIDYLKENLRDFRGVNDVNKLGRDVERALKGLKVTVTHRATKQKFTIMGLTKKSTRFLSFPCVDREGKIPTTHVMVVDYFVEKYGKDIVYKDIPCLELGNRKDAVPMEFCVIAHGQRYPKEKLDNRSAKLLRDISVVDPNVRRNTICQIVRSEYGPCGGQVAQNFGLEMDTNMTGFTARVLEPPTVKLGNSITAKLDQDKCQWNLVRKTLVKGVPILRWALLDFSAEDRNWLNQDKFIYELMSRCKSLGIRMEDPLAIRSTNMDQLRSIEDVRGWLGEVIQEASRKSKERLQVIVCVMAQKHSGYDLLKLVSETELGVLTQCCLSENANKDRNDQFLANLALKMNAKVGGSNFELDSPLPGLESENHVMFIGADVNHPAPLNANSPSIAAVVATVNWPAVNRYAARICPQEHRKEKIVDFGSMCLDLVDTYARLNKVKPKKIVVFRDGVSDSQFDMVLNEELSDLKNAIYEEHYKPDITLIVAQKRHHTRLFLENERDGVRPFNVPPGTVVDSTITHPSQFDFYLCSHFGGLGTSKSTHYQALWDKHHFTSDELQKLIYDLCFTFARCTKPVSLVPPVYYADLVAYRGRLYHDAMMELQSRGSTSSSSSKTSSSSSSAASFDKSFFKVHPNLQDSMFFV